MIELVQVNVAGCPRRMQHLGFNTIHLTPSGQKSVQTVPQVLHTSFNGKLLENK